MKLENHETQKQLKWDNSKQREVNLRLLLSLQEGRVVRKAPFGVPELFMTWVAFGHTSLKRVLQGNTSEPYFLLG